MADTAFISFPFAATGGSASRTMPARLNDVINVLEYGADPTGVADSTDEIRAALHAAGNLGTASSIGQKGGICFFPPGKYKVSDVLYHDVNDSTVTLIGSGKFNTTIFGNLGSEFIIRIGDTTRTFTNISDMGFVNTSTNALTGGAKLPYMDACTLRNCYFEGVIACDFGDNTFNSAAYNCDFVGPGHGVSGSIAVSIGQCGLYNCRASNAERGIAVWNTGSVIAGCYVEHCDIGIHEGYSYQDSSDSTTAFSIHGTRVNECNIGVWYTNANSGITTGLLVEGAVGPDGVTPPQYGIYMETCSYHLSAGVSITAAASITGWHIVNYPGQTFIGCNSDAGSGADWVIPSGIGSNYLNCNNPAYLMTISALGSAVGKEGAIYNVTDSNTATWGATATGSSSNHVRVRSNGTNWTVVGK